MGQDKHHEPQVHEEQFELPDVSFDEFSIPTYEEWKTTVEGILKGKDFQKSMYTKTYEGITLQPMYWLSDQEGLTQNLTYPGRDSNLRGAKASGYIHTPWTIAQRCDGKTIADMHDMLQFELDKGSTAISFTLDSATRKGQDATKAEAKDVADAGVSLSTVEEVEALLKGMDLTTKELDIRTGASSVCWAAALHALCESQGVDVKSLSGMIGADPIGTLAQDGHLSRPMDEYFDDMAHTIAWASAHAPQLRTVLVDTDVYHNGGGNDVQELGFAMSTAVTYLREMERRGIDVNTFAKQIRFHVSVGANFFMEIAKLRAIKMVWAQIIEHCGGDEEAKKINLFVSTSHFTQTVFDPYVNLLRAGSQSFSAVVGGMDGMFVRPLDGCIRPSDEFSRRIARNIQIMEQQEFNFIQPVDPAGGSWYLEPLTQELTEKSWALFQELEGKGGILETLVSGETQEAVDAILQSRFKNLATRKDRAVGSNMYPNMMEELLEVPVVDFEGLRQARVAALANVGTTDAAELALKKLQESDFSEIGSLVSAAYTALVAGASFGQVFEALADGSEGITVKAILSHRWTEQYEELRMRTENFKETHNGDNVKIFLANMGPIPQHKARADFVTSFMQVAEFDVLTNDGFPTVDEAVAAALASNADVTIVCSTDDTYPELAPAVTKAIKAARPAMKVFLAGAPSPELKELCDAAGMDDYISVRSNCYQTLLAMQREKGMM